jgi:transcriptional regulator with XRE-family HTH domain
MAQPKNIIGPRVRLHRNQHGWSQSVLAAKCQLFGWDISRSIVAAIEGRVRWVGDFELVMLAKVLKTSPQELLPKQLNLTEFLNQKH